MYVRENEEAVAWLVENDEVAKIGNSLLGTTAAYEGNLNEIVNRFAEMKQDFEAKYTGEELETKLKQLDKAFDFTVDAIAHDSAEAAKRKMFMESFRINFHNATLNAGMSSTMYSGGKITELSDEKKEDIYTKIFESVKEATIHFANLTKQFVKENGKIKDDNDIKLLNAFLENAERPKDKFTYNDLKTFNEITSQVMVHNRKETLFTQLFNTFEFLN